MYLRHNPKRGEIRWGDSFRSIFLPCATKKLAGGSEPSLTRNITVSSLATPARVVESRLSSRPILGVGTVSIGVHVVDNDRVVALVLNIAPAAPVTYIKVQYPKGICPLDQLIACTIGHDVNIRGSRGAPIVPRRCAVNMNMVDV